MPGPALRLGMTQNPDAYASASAPGGQGSGSAPDLSTHGRLWGLAQGTRSQSPLTLPAAQGPALVDPRPRLSPVSGSLPLLYNW